MSIAAISTLLPETSNSTANAPSTQALQPSVNVQADTVQLTVAERVYQLHNQGQQVSQIAQALSLSVAAVNNYLNINESGSVKTP